MKQTELVLHTNKMRATFGGYICCFSDLRNGKIRATDLAYFSGTHQLIERTERIGNRRLGIGLLQQISMVPTFLYLKQPSIIQFSILIRYRLCMAILILLL